MLSIKESKDRVQKLYELLDPCFLCPRKCGARRLSGQIGVCGAGEKVRLASWASHRGEEPPVSGTKGSGTIFSSFCPMKCFYCQNYPFSQLGNGKEFERDELVGIFFKTAKMGVHNINLVTPTHFVPQLFDALVAAREKSLDLPLVYNTSGYERIEVLRVLDGMVDIYLPDIKYSANSVAMTLSKAPDYVENDRAAIQEMFRQVGFLQVDRNEIGSRGVIIRHLVLPGGLANTKTSFEWLRENFGTKIHISLMCQYFPAHLAPGIDGMNRRITEEEYLEALNLAEEMGFENVWAQDPDLPGGA